MPRMRRSGEHVLHFVSSGHRPTKSGIEDLAKSFGLSPKNSKCIISDVASAFVDWESTFNTQDVSGRDIKRLSKDIERRRALFG